MIDFQNEIVEMYVRREGEEEGRGNGRGRRFIKWVFDKRLRANQTAVVMAKLRQNINNFAEAERWVNEEENKRLNLDNIERPNTKWTFVKFSNIEVKAVLDNQPMLGTGPLPDWLKNLAHGRKMVSLDTFGDNMCVWRCIAVYQGARPDRCTQLASKLARGFFKLDIVPRTCLDELDKVEGYLNKEKQLREWIGIRAYEPKRQENGEIYWHLRKNSSDKLKNIMTIGIYEGHATSPNWQKRTFAMIAGAASQKLATFKDTPKHAHKEEQQSIAQTRTLKRHRLCMTERFTTSATHNWQ